MDGRNFYDPPFVAMIHSGSFWRCPHGKTRFATKAGCGRCAIKRTRKWFSFLVDRYHSAPGRRRA